MSWMCEGIRIERGANMNHDLNRRQLIFLGAALAGAGIYDAGEKVVKPKNFLLVNGTQGGIPHILCQNGNSVD